MRVLCKNMRITLGKTKNCEDVRATGAPNIPADIGHATRDSPYNPPRLLLIVDCFIMGIASLERLNLTPVGASQTKTRGEIYAEFAGTQQLSCLLEAPWAPTWRPFFQSDAFGPFFYCVFDQLR